MTKRQAAIVERTLPCSLEAERAVLGAILMHNDAYAVVGGLLVSTDFYRDAHRRIFASLDRLLEFKSGAADLLTVREDLTRRGELEEVGGPAYITKLVDGIPRSINVEHYARIVKEKALLRGAIFAMNEVVSDAYAAEETSGAIFAKCDKALIELQADGGKGKLLALEATAPALLADLEWRHAHKGEVTGVPTGFASLDAITLGWQKGDLIVLGARPSIGKTTFVLNSATAGAQIGKRVAVFSLEMRRQQLEYRMLSALSGVPLSRCLSGHFMEADWERLSFAAGVMGTCPIYVNDAAGLTLRDIRTECRRLKAEAGLDLVVIDYAQLIAPSEDLRRGSSRQEIVSDISYRSKRLAGDLEVPVILLSQLSRAGDKRNDPRPKLSDLRESGSLEQDADIVALLHRRNHREGGLTHFLIEKQRNGPTGTLKLTLDRDVVQFTDGYDGPAEEAEAPRARKVKRVGESPDSPVKHIAKTA